MIKLPLNDGWRLRFEDLHVGREMPDWLLQKKDGRLKIDIPLPAVGWFLFLRNRHFDNNLQVLFCIIKSLARPVGILRKEYRKMSGA